MINLNKLGPRIIVYFGHGNKLFLDECVCYQMIICAILAVAGILLGRNLQKVPKGKQVLVELFVGWVYKFSEGQMGKSYGEKFAPFLGTLILWLVCCSSTGLLGLRPVTADINVTAGLAIVSFVVIQGSVVKELGFRGKIGEMCDPYPFMLPIELINDITFPVTLALRLFGNIFGGMIVVDMWMGLMTNLSLKLCSVPFLRCLTVIPLNCFFDIFEPVIQAYIFTILTAAHLGSGLSGPSPETLARRNAKKEKRLAGRAEKKARAENTA